MSLKRFIKTQVLSSYNKERIVFLIGVVSIFFSSIISVFAANYLYSSSEVSFDNSSSGISSDNVQGAIDELYQNASDYSSLESRIGVLEGRWKNSPESYFEKSGTDEWLYIKNSNSSGNRGVMIYDDSNVRRGALYFDTTNTYLTSYDSNGIWGKGKLNLRGNPVMVNGVDHFSDSGVITLNSTYKAYYRRVGKTVSVWVNNTNNASISHGTLLGTLPDGYRPNDVMSARDYNNTNGACLLGTDGKLWFNIPGTNSGSTKYLRCTITFLAA